MSLLWRHETLDIKHTEPHEGQGTLSSESGPRTGTSRVLGEPTMDRRGWRRHVGARTSHSLVDNGDSFCVWQGHWLETHYFCDQESFKEPGSSGINDESFAVGFRGCGVIGITYPTAADFRPTTDATRRDGNNRSYGSTAPNTFLG
jgi:hypothetical protein